MICLQEKLPIEQIAIQSVKDIAGLRRMRLQTVQYIFWISQCLTHLPFFCIELRKLPSFAMYAPLTRSDYYEGSVAILDIQGLTLIALSSVPT